MTMRTLHQPAACPLRPPRLGKRRAPDCADCYFFDEDTDINTDGQSCVKERPEFLRRGTVMPYESFAPSCGDYRERPHCRNCRAEGT